MNKIIEETIKAIETNPEYQCYIENNTIPCKSNCARYYENLCENLQHLIIEIKKVSK